ncbi:MAG: hypothetical protein DWQ04_33075 [Chloroflexi bacterium]|nr:MAG: hypothetical protein DWQ04_33075 [Chloroflexota bacterium]
MTHLSLNLLGGFEAALGGEPVKAFGADKVRALLSFLAIESSSTHRREKLMAMFWPDLPRKRAAHNLSQSLLRLRKAVGEQKGPSTPKFLLATTQDIQFNPNSDFQLDVLRFRELLHLCERHYHTDRATCETCTQWLTQAAELYKGDLLAGFFIPNSVGFEEWRLMQQEELHQQALKTLQRLVAYHERQEQFDQVERFARRQIALEPWHDEESRMKLMQAFVNNGKIGAALEQYEQYQNTLATELGVKPAAPITGFYEQIRTGEVGYQAASQPKVQESGWLSAQGERRQVTVLACNPAAPCDFEEIHEKINFCKGRCEGVFHRFGGRRAPRQGSTCLVYFGFPQAHEDAARRAVQAGLAAAASFEGNNSVKIGIHTGEVLVGEKRGKRWQDRDLIGPTLEIACDCQRQAESGSVVITEASKRLVEGVFELRPLGSHHIHIGTQTPFYQVHDSSNLPDRINWLVQTQRLTPFAGRKKEMRQLKNCRDQAFKGYGQVVFLNGQPGIGKSRIIWELKENTHSKFSNVNDQPQVRWLAGRCLPHYQNSSLFPMIDLLEQLLGFQGDDSVETRREKLRDVLVRYEVGGKRPFSSYPSCWNYLPTSQLQK